MDWSIKPTRFIEKVMLWEGIALEIAALTSQIGSLIKKSSTNSEKTPLLFNIMHYNLHHGLINQINKIYSESDVVKRGTLSFVSLNRMKVNWKKFENLKVLI